MKKTLCRIIILVLLTVVPGMGLTDAEKRNYGELRGCTEIAVNSIDLENGATMYASPDEASEVVNQFCNGSGGSLLEVDETKTWAKLQINRFIGYMKTTDLTPLDGSYGLYPIDDAAYLYGFSYFWGNEMPKDIQEAFDDEKWDDYHSVMGAIPANGCRAAAVVMKKDETNKLCLLKRTSAGWELTAICDKLLYQGNWLPEELKFSLPGTSFHISYPPTENKFHDSFTFDLKENTDVYYLRQYAYTPYTYEDEIHGLLSYGTDWLNTSLTDGRLVITAEVNFVTTEHITPYGEDVLLANDFDVERLIRIVYSDEHIIMIHQ